VRRSAWFSEVERGLAEEIARRTGLGPDLDTYPLLVVTTAIGAIRVATTVWQERPRPGTLSDLVDETFDALGHGLTLLQPVGAHRPVAPPARERPRHTRQGMSTRSRPRRRRRRRRRPGVRLAADLAGLPALTIDVDLGGLSRGFVELAVVLEELGRVAVVFVDAAR
jgi:alkylation response protein AidB-like acyl-CoA dehydrogenase